MFVLLFLIIGGKILLTKVFSLVIMLLLFTIKGQQLRKNQKSFDDYLMSVTEKLARKCIFVVYAISTLLSSIAAYFTLNAFNFEYSLLFTIVLTLVCMLITIIKYNKKGKDEILKTIYKIHHPEEKDVKNNK